jgi:hypothetical protein
MGDIARPPTVFSGAENGQNTTGYSSPRSRTANWIASENVG